MRHVALKLVVGRGKGLKVEGGALHLHLLVAEKGEGGCFCVADAHEAGDGRGDVAVVVGEGVGDGVEPRALDVDGVADLDGVCGVWVDNVKGVDAARAPPAVVVGGARVLVCGVKACVGGEVAEAVDVQGGAGDPLALGLGVALLLGELPLLGVDAGVVLWRAPRVNVAVASLVRAVARDFSGAAEGDDWGLCVL